MLSLYVSEDVQLVHPGQEGEGGGVQGLRDDRGKTETQKQDLEYVGPIELPTAASAVRDFVFRRCRQQVRLRVSTRCGERFQSEEGSVK